MTAISLCLRLPIFPSIVTRIHKYPQDVSLLTCALIGVTLTGKRTYTTDYLFLDDGSPKESPIQHNSTAAKALAHKLHYSQTEVCFDFFVDLPEVANYTFFQPCFPHATLSHPPRCNHRLFSFSWWRCTWLLYALMRHAWLHWSVSTRSS